MLDDRGVLGGVVAAMAEQSALLNTHTRYLSEPVVRYAERLAEPR